jgi:hypothetical protein
MPFRRDKEQALRWRTWLQKHRDELLACGVPHIVLDDKSHWYYFLEHGHFVPTGSTEPIIDVDRMSLDGALRLCLFLEQDDLYPGCAARNRLQYLLRRGRHAAPTSS